MLVIPSSFGRNNMETKRNFIRMHQLITVPTTQQLRRFSIAAILFVIACKELKIAQIMPGQLHAKSGNFQTNFAIFMRLS